MAAGWIAALKMVPWADVVGSAPVVADGAKKLWNAVARKKASPAAGEITPDVPAGAGTMARMEAKVAALESKVSELEHEMLSSSEVIKALAEQNARLIQMLDLFRRRQRLLMIAGALLAIAAGASLFLLMVR